MEHQLYFLGKSPKFQYAYENAQLECTQLRELLKLFAVQTKALGDVPANDLCETNIFGVQEHSVLIDLYYSQFNKEIFDTDSLKLTMSHAIILLMFLSVSIPDTAFENVRNLFNELVTYFSKHRIDLKSESGVLKPQLPEHLK